MMIPRDPDKSETCYFNGWTYICASNYYIAEYKEISQNPKSVTKFYLMEQCTNND